MASTETNQSKNKKRIQFVVFNGIIAALYVVLTYFLAPISYGPVQARQPYWSCSVCRLLH